MRLKDLGEATSNGMDRILNSKIVLVVLAGLSIWLGLSVWGIKLQEKSVNDEARNIDKKIETAKKENSNLEKYISNLQNPAFLERIARLKLNYQASGEQVVFVYRDTAPKKSSESFEDKLKDSPNYAKWWYWLFGYGQIKN